MKKALLLLGVLLLAAAWVPAATAAGVNLAWGQYCWAEREVPSNLVTFACNTNATSIQWQMTASFASPVEITDFVGYEVYIDGVSSTGTIPNWWRMYKTTECRYATDVFVTSMPDYTSLSGYTGACQDVFVGTAMGGGGLQMNTNGQLIIQGVYAVALPGILLPGNTEVYGCTFTVKNSKTTGTGSCAGCGTPICFALTRVFASGVETGVDITLAQPGGNQCLYWQSEFGNPICAGPVPVRNATWGQIKTLYR